MSDSNELREDPESLVQRYLENPREDLKDLIIVRGRNHHPQDLEHTSEESHEALKAHGNAAFSVDLDGRERVIIVQEVARPKKFDLEEISRTIREAVLTTHDVVFESTGPAPDGERSVGREAVRVAWQPIFADRASRFTVEELFVSGDRALQRWVYVWGDGHVRGVDLFILRDGKVAEKVSYVKG